tara:strand:+ start:86 stop:616 length:531 start_codon:yes stop_codon:yes gene_type:complete
MSTFIQLPPRYNPGLYTQIVDGPTVGNTLVETSVVGTGIGSLTIPANGFKVGDSFHAKIGGLITTQPNHTITIKAKSDGTVLETTGVVTLEKATNQPWELELDFTIRSIGATGVIKTNGNFIYNRNSGSYIGLALGDTEVFDTTVSNTLDITVEWGQEDVTDSITVQQFILYKTFI